MEGTEVKTVIVEDKKTKRTTKSKVKPKSIEGNDVLAQENESTAEAKVVETAKATKTTTRKTAAKKTTTSKAKVEDSNSEKKAKTTRTKTTKSAGTTRTRSKAKVEDKSVDIDIKAEVTKVIEKETEVAKAAKKPAAAKTTRTRKATTTTKKSAKVTEEVKVAEKVVAEVKVDEKIVEEIKVISAIEAPVVATNTTRAIEEMDEYLFHAGRHLQAYNFMGAHVTVVNNVKGVRFTTWAPRASKIVVVGDFSYWQPDENYAMERVSDAGLWTAFIPGIEPGAKYKFAVTNQWGNWTTYKADPYAFKAELRPNTASVVAEEKAFEWEDNTWLDKRKITNPYEAPMNTYEVHLGSWKTKDGNFMTYQELSEALPKYVKEMGYTHIELMPVNEHPLDASWGYQATGYYAASSRFGDFEGLKALINNLHKEEIGVILDWVPGHFCKDEQGLINFDGSPTYEYQAGWKADNKGWGTNNFDLGRPEVKSFLISNAMYWINEFHIDGLRVDAVSNILYLDYGRNHGEWEQNCFGDRGNLEGIQFVKDLNWHIKEFTPGVVTIAEESTAWPGITAPVEHDGLGFTFKWNMGWMNDTLRYVELDPVYRKYHHNLMNFSMMYHYSEKFVLPISHDEVVHGKGSLINKMNGDNWNKYAGLRAYAAYMIAHPGKKLLFMGSEFGQFIEWREYEELQWHVINQYEAHKKTQDFFKELNKFYKENKALWELDYDNKGFQWIDADNSEKSILTFIRRGKSEEDTLIFVCNFTPVVYYDFKLGVPADGKYVEAFNTDNLAYGGSDQRIIEELTTTEGLCHGQPYSVNVKVPPTSVLVLRKQK